MIEKVVANFRKSLFIISLGLVILGGFVSNQELNGAKSAANPLKELPKMPVPQTMRFIIGSVAVEKDGEKIVGKEIRTFFGTEPGQKEQEGEISKISLDKETFLEIWNYLKKFDFSSYAGLTRKDLSDSIPYQDAYVSNEFSLEIDGKKLISFNGGEWSGFNDAKLNLAYKDLAEFTEQRIKAFKIKKILPQQLKLKNPKTLTFVFAKNIQLLKEDNNIKIVRYYQSDEDEEFFRKNLSDLSKLSQANKEIRLTSDTSIEVLIGEKDFLEIWNEIKKVDFIRFIKVGREDFNFRPQKITFTLGLIIDGNEIVNWGYVDRDMKKEVSLPLLNVNNLIEKKLYEKIDQIRK